MKEYYVSSYLSPPGLRAVTSLRHDQAIALWCKDDRAVRLLRYWQLERLSGLKHHAMPLFERSQLLEVLERLLRLEGVELDDVVEFWGTPGIERTEVLPGFDAKGLPLHTISHVFSGLCLDGHAFRTSSIIALAMDGGPDFTLEQRPVGEHWYAGAISRKGKVDLVPIESPGQLWEAAEHEFGLEAGSLMALATASSIELDLDPGAITCAGYWGGAGLGSRCKALISELGERARGQIDAWRQGRLDGHRDDGLSTHELAASAVMKVVQAASVEICRRNLTRLFEQNPDLRPEECYLSMSGGYALNCPTNSYLMSEYKFRGLLAPPCADDSGQALGLGALGFYARGDLDSLEIRVRMPDCGSPVRSPYANAGKWSDYVLAATPFDTATFVSDVAKHPVGWVEGCSEVGPRALGFRSLLADPRTAEAKDKLNELKQRQWWRPVAPVVLEEQAATWFENARRSPHMLETFQLRRQYEAIVPAVRHLDGSARVQTVAGSDNPHLYDAIRAFYLATGVPMLCNTSLNDRGEPIADDPSEAFNFCLRKGVRVLYVDQVRYELHVGQHFGLDKPQERVLAPQYTGQQNTESLLRASALDPLVLYLLFIWPAMHQVLEQRGGERRLEKIARHLAGTDESFARRAEDFVRIERSLFETRKLSLVSSEPAAGGSLDLRVP